MNTQTKTPPPRASADSPAPGDNPGARETASAAFHDAARRFSEIREYIAYYIAVQTDAIKLTLRKVIFFAVLGVIGLLAAASAVVMSVVLLMSGIAHGIGAALGHRPWLGDLIVGVLILGGLAFGAKLAIKKVIGSSRLKTVQKYESRKSQQRSQFGHDVKERTQHVA